MSENLRSFVFVDVAAKGNARNGGGESETPVCKDDKVKGDGETTEEVGWWFVETVSDTAKVGHLECGATLHSLTNFAPKFGHVRCVCGSDEVHDGTIVALDECGFSVG